MSKRMPLPEAVPGGVKPATHPAPAPKSGLSGHFAKMPQKRTAPLPSPAETDELPQLTPAADAIGSAVNEMVLEKVVLIPVADVVVSPFQPRLTFDMESLAALGLSISSDGLVNPIIVRKLPNGKFELVGGERRWRAFKLLNKVEIPAFVRELTDEQAAILALSDNSRDDLSDFESGRKFKKLLDDGLVPDQETLAARVGRSQSTITRCLAYFKLPESVIKLLESNPRLIGTRVSSKFGSYTEQGYATQVIEAVQRIVDGQSQEQASQWLDNAINKKKDPKAPAVTVPLAMSGMNVGSVKIEGKKLVMNCANGVDPAKIRDLVLMLLKDQTLDSASDKSSTD